jgi:TRAP-type mannitol/chloroaromatic compound transport system permease small subunit
VKLSAARLLDGLTRGMNALGTCVVLFIMGVVLTDVIGRGLFSKPLTGTAEMVAMSIAVVVYLQFPSTLAAGRVIAADGLVAWLGKRSVRAEQWLLGVHHAIGAGLFAVTARYVWALLLIAYDSGDYYGNPAMFSFPKWPIISVVLLGCAIMSLQYLLMALGFMRCGYQRRRLLEIDPSTKAIS